MSVKDRYSVLGVLDLILDYVVVVDYLLLFDLQFSAHGFLLVLFYRMKNLV